jgi:hypothetical protein
VVVMIVGSEIHSELRRPRDAKGASPQATSIVTTANSAVARDAFRTHPPFDCPLTRKING